MKHVLAVMALLCAGCLASPDPPASPEPGPAPPIVETLQTLATFPEMRVETDFGTIRAILYADWAPQTVAHITGLIEDGFYDGLIYHRVIDDFVVQGGDPTGTGEGGSGPGGISIDHVPLEIIEGLDFGSGAIGLARWTDDTGDSQYWFTEKPALHLSRPSGTTGQVFGAYALFGQVFEGQDIVRQIAAVPTLPGDRPIDDVVMRSVTLHPLEGVDVIGLLPVVHDTFQHAGGAGTLEMPRHLVAGHPFWMLAIVDAETCHDGMVAGFWTRDDTTTTPDWQATSDPCTWQARMSLPAGDWTFFGGSDVAGRDTPVLVDVAPWHPGYAPFTGTVMNAA